MIPISFLSAATKLYYKAVDWKLNRDDYNLFTIKTKNKVRHICEPKQDLKKFHQDCAELFNTLPTSSSCHSKPGSSTVHNALPHVGAHIIYKTDIADFYPTIEHPSVIRGYEPLINELGYSVTTAAMTERFNDLLTYCFTKHSNGLPTGAPTSPSLSNVAMYAVDQYIDNLCKEHGFIYTRYFDDLTFSKNDSKVDSEFAKAITNILNTYGFRIRDDKSKWVLPNTHEAFEVTGINIGNDRTTIPRPIKRLVRVLLDRKADNKLETPEVLDGYLAYISMVDKEYRDKLDNYYKERLNYHGNKHT